MPNFSHWSEKMEAFVLGELSPSEKADFEEEMAQDEKLKKDVAFLMLLPAALKEVRLREHYRSLLAAEKEHATSYSPPSEPQTSTSIPKTSPPKPDVPKKPKPAAPLAAPNTKPQVKSSFNGKKVWVLVAVGIGLLVIVSAGVYRFVDFGDTPSPAESFDTRENPPLGIQASIPIETQPPALDDSATLAQSGHDPFLAMDSTDAPVKNEIAESSHNPTQLLSVITQVESFQEEAINRTQNIYERYAARRFSNLSGLEQEESQSSFLDVRPALSQISDLLRQREGQIASTMAAELLRQTPLAQPDSFQAYCYLGIAYSLQRKWDSATYTFQEMDDHDQRDLLNSYQQHLQHWWLSQAYLCQGRWQDAESYLNLLARRPGVWQKAAQEQLEAKFWIDSDG